MLRAVVLTIEHEARLLVRDPIVAFMLVLAPVVIITVAGYSLGALYGGGGRAFVVPVVDRDGGEVASRVVEALGREPRLRIERLDDPAAARRAIRRSDRAPVAIEIPAGTSEAVTAGRDAKLLLYVDPARRIEVNALELEIGRFFRRLSAEARAESQGALDAAASELRARLSDEARRGEAAARAEIDRAAARLRSELARAEARAAAAVETAVRAEEARARAAVEAELASRAAAARELERRLAEARAAVRAFDEWLAELRRIAGSRADDIPPPPAPPALPSEAELAALTRPPAPPALDAGALAAALRDALDVRLPEPSAPDAAAASDVEVPPPPVLPGTLDLVERPATEGAPVRVNAFDQYVPGFGVTFLLIGMMLGVSLTLFDEREWGTLERLRAGGAPIAGVLVGKVLARFAVGVVQMVLLFAVGRVLFGVSLGPQPLGLLLPTISMSFAAAALGLVVTALARSHDAVMPIGTMTSLALSAIGGCWWPIDFEPPWMQAAARWLPTTWTMQAYNDLMIRRLPASAAVEPFLATAGLGAAVLAVGVWALLRQGTRAG